LNILGYTTRPNYDTSIHTIRVLPFKTRILEDTVRRGVEFELTEAVIREIELKTPYKVVSAGCDADTELTGTIVSYTKGILNNNQENLVREAETLLTAEVVWKNLRTGEVLSAPRRKPQDVPPAALNAPVTALPPPPPPVLVQSSANFIPEVGQSFASARQKNVDNLAVQIVSMMEKPW